MNIWAALSQGREFHRGTSALGLSSFALFNWRNIGMSYLSLHTPRLNHRAASERHIVHITILFFTMTFYNI